MYTLEKQILQIILFPFIEFPLLYLGVLTYNNQVAALKPHGFKKNKALQEWWIENI